IFLLRHSLAPLIIYFKCSAHELIPLFLFFLFLSPTPTNLYTLSLHDALPISFPTFRTRHPVQPPESSTLPTPADSQQRGFQRLGGGEVTFELRFRMVLVTRQTCANRGQLNQRNANLR